MLRPCPSFRWQLYIICFAYRSEFYPNCTCPTIPSQYLLLFLLPNCRPLSFFPSPPCNVFATILHSPLFLQHLPQFVLLLSHHFCLTTFSIMESLLIRFHICIHLLPCLPPLTVPYPCPSTSTSVL